MNTSGVMKTTAPIAALVAILSACSSQQDSVVPEPSQTPAEEQTWEFVDEGITIIEMPKPVPVGQPVEYNDWAFVVKDVNTDAWPVIRASNPHNHKPSGQYVMVGLEVTNNSGTIGWAPLGARLLGADKVIYEDEGQVTPCDVNDCPREAVPGGTLRVELTFDVPAAAIPGATLLIGYQNTEAAIS